MSRIGRQPIAIPEGVTSRSSRQREVKGPKGGSRSGSRADDGRARDAGTGGGAAEHRGQNRALHGLTRGLVANMVEGVTEGFERRLEIQGIGYRPKLAGKTLTFDLGYSHPIVLDAAGGRAASEVRADGDRCGGRQVAVGQFAAARSGTRAPRPVQGQGRALRRRSPCARRSGRPARSSRAIPRGETTWV